MNRLGSKQIKFIIKAIVNSKLTNKEIADMQSISIRGYSNCTVNIRRTALYTFRKELEGIKSLFLR
ncbi:MAG: hypothetical protein ACP5U0_08670, partial [Caldisphaera sp.]